MTMRLQIPRRSNSFYGLQFAAPSRTIINYGVRCFFAFGKKTFHSLPLFHSREGGNLFPHQREIPRSGSAMSPIGECGCRRRDSCLRRNGRGAGMEEGGGMGEGAGMEEKRAATTTEKNPSRLSPRNCKTNAMPLKTITHWRQNFCGQKFRPSAP